jgi:hypothetical protein
MSIRFEIHSDPSFVEAVYSGSLARGEMRATAREITTTARKYGTPLRLADCTGLEGSLSIIDLYEVADELARDRPGHSIREAIVLPDLPWLDGAVRFWESTCTNRGLLVRTFKDRESALAWLHGTTTRTP